MGQVPLDPGGCGATIGLIALDHVCALFHGRPPRHYEGRYEVVVNLSEEDIPGSRSRDIGYGFVDLGRPGWEQLESMG